MNLRRTKIEIINDILKSIQGKGGKIKPTHLLYKSNLSHTKMKEYINELKEKDMISEELEENNKYFRITDKGLKYVSEYKKIMEFSDSFGL